MPVVHNILILEEWMSLNEGGGFFVYLPYTEYVSFGILVLYIVTEQRNDSETLLLSLF